LDDAEPAKTPEPSPAAPILPDVVPKDDPSEPVSHTKVGAAKPAEAQSASARSVPAIFKQEIHTQGAAVEPTPAASTAKPEPEHAAKKHETEKSDLSPVPEIKPAVSPQIQTEPVQVSAPPAQITPQATAPIQLPPDAQPNVASPGNAPPAIRQIASASGKSPIAKPAVQAPASVSLAKFSPATQPAESRLAETKPDRPLAATAPNKPTAALPSEKTAQDQPVATTAEPPAKPAAPPTPSATGGPALKPPSSLPTDALSAAALPAAAPHIALPTSSKATELNISTPVIKVTAPTSPHPAAKTDTHPAPAQKPTPTSAKDADTATAPNSARHEAIAAPTPAAEPASADSATPERPAANVLPTASPNSSSSSPDSTSTRSAATLPHQDAPPPTTPDVQTARLVNRSGQEEMHIGLRTPAFGNVEVHTVMRQSEIGVSVGSEKGDLHNFLANEVSSLQANFREHDLTFSNVRFSGSGAMTGNSGEAGGHAQPGNYPSQPQYRKTALANADSDAPEVETSAPLVRGLSLHA
jgi:hypothetical protein